MKKFYWASLIALIFALVSCNNQENPMEEKSLTFSKDVELVDGRLRFKNHYVFYQVIKGLQKNSIEKWISEPSQFKSMAQAFKEFSDNDIMGTSNPALLKKLSICL